MEKRCPLSPYIDDRAICHTYSNVSERCDDCPVEEVIPGRNFTWENHCEECGELFRCEQHIPKNLVKKMEREGDDDCIFEYMGETSNSKVRMCSKCRKDMGVD